MAKVGNTPEEVKAYMRAYYQKRRDELKARAAARYDRIKDDPGFKAKAKRDREKRHFGVSRKRVFRKTGGVCFYCPRAAQVVHHLDGDGRGNEAKGLKPGHDFDRLVPACRSCHMKLHWKQLRTALALKRAGKWADRYDCCRSCKRTDRKHGGKGLCKTCYARTAYRVKSRACSL